MEKTEICIIRQLFNQFVDFIILEKIHEEEGNLEIYYKFYSYDDVDSDIDLDVQHFYEMKSKILKHLEILCKEILYEGYKKCIRLVTPLKTLEYKYDVAEKIIVFKKTKQLL